MAVCDLQRYWLLIHNSYHPNLLQPQSSQSQSNIASPITNQSPPAPFPVPVLQHTSINGIGPPAISILHVEVAKGDGITAPALPSMFIFPGIFLKIDVGMIFRFLRHAMTLHTESDLFANYQP